MTPDQSTLDAIASMDAAELSELLTHLTPAERAEFNAILANVHVPLWKPNPGPQSLAYDSKADELFYGGSAGGGKCPGVHVPVLTTNGYKLLGDIQVGDQVFGVDGKPCDVIYTSEIMHGHECFDIEFDDGSVITADADHKWKTFTYDERSQIHKRSDEYKAKRRSRRQSRGIGKRPDLAKMNAERAKQHKSEPVSGGIRTTTEILSTLTARKGIAKNHGIQVCAPLVLPEQDLPIHPYLMGYWLGNGNSRCVQLCIADYYIENLRNIFLDVGYKLRSVPSGKYCYSIHGIRHHFGKLNLLQNKHIPQQYLFASFEQRLDLLRGLMDSDGYACKNGQCEFYSSRKSLIDDASRLLHTLGIKHCIRTKKKPPGTPYGVSYRIKFVAPFHVFKLDIKRERQNLKLRDTQKWRYIVDIRPVPSVPVRCIGVNSPDHLYLIGEACIPTHNTDLILGLALTKHKKSLILRRQATSLPAIMDRLRELVDIHGSIRGSGYGGFCRTQDGRQLELAGCKDEQDKTKYQGRPHDCKLFDEITEFTKTQYTFINTWLRTADPRQRCRIVATGNPPTSSEGEWIIKHWGPWLDEQHPNPAKPTELRWYAMVDGKEQEFMTAAQFIHNGEVIRPRSRTFIPARIEDNPIYMASGYRDVLAALEEPLRSMMLYGDFKVKRTDDVWQVIPRDWVIQAQKRWTPQGKTGTLDCVGVDVGRGSDPSVISRRYGTWFAPLLKYTGTDSDDGPKVAAHVAMAISENPKVPVNIDVIGLGASPYDSCKQMGMRAFPINFAASSDKKDRAGILRMRNLRAFAYWSMREALDPKKGDCIALPPDPDLLADLTAPKWSLTVGGILIESKDEIKHRLGRSTDSGDAVVMAALPIRYTEFKMERI